MFKQLLKLKNNLLNQDNQRPAPELRLVSNNPEAEAADTAHHHRMCCEEDIGLSL